MAGQYERLEDKLDKCTDAVTALSVSLTEQTTRLEAFPKVQSDVADHEKRLTALEQLELRGYDKRLDQLERAVSGFKGWLAGATAVAMAVGGLVAWVVSTLAGKVVG